MGMDKYTHIGAFLMIPKLRKNIKRTIRVNASGKEVKGGHKFDPVSGKEYQVIEVVENIENRPRTYGDDEHYPEFEKLGLEEDAFWEPEGCGTKKHCIFLAEDSLFKEREIQSLKGLDVDDELSKFIAKHAAYIQYYEKVYGPIIVDYGIVEYWA